MAPGPKARLGGELREMMDYYCASSQHELNPIELGEQLSVIADYVLARLLSKTESYQDGTSRLSKTLHAAAQRGHQDIITVTLSYLEENQKFALLVQDEHTPLHDAANSGHSCCVKALLTLLKPEQQVVLMTKKSKGNTAANLATSTRNEETAAVLKEYQDAVETHIKELIDEAFQNYCERGLSSLYDINRFEDLLFAVSVSESMEILKRKLNVFSYTPLEFASFSGHAELITTILSSLPQSERLELLLGDGYTPLHFAATRGDTKCVKAILTPLTPKQQLKLMDKVYKGETASDSAGNNKKADAVCLLNFFRLKSEQKISGEESELGGSGDRRSMEHLQDLLIHEKEQVTQLKEQINQLCEIIHEKRTEFDQSRPLSDEKPETENIVKEQIHGIPIVPSQHTQLQQITELQGITDEMGKTVDERRFSISSVIERHKGRHYIVEMTDKTSEALGSKLHYLADPVTNKGFSKEDHKDDDNDPAHAAWEYVSYNKDPNARVDCDDTTSNGSHQSLSTDTGSIYEENVGDGLGDSDIDASSGSWQSLSTASDVTSIPEELSESLNGFHDTTHKLLRNSSEGTSSNLTCTIVSHSLSKHIDIGNESGYHLLVISEGYRDLVSSYISNHNDNVLKVSTSHISNTSLRQKHNQEFEAFPHALIAILSDNPVKVETLQTEKLPKADNGKVKYRHRSIGVDFSKDDCSVHLSVYSESEDVLDAIKSSYKDMRADNQFAHIVQSLNILEDSGSSAVVTVVLMSVEENNGEFRSLYKFVAGDIKDDPEDFGKNWILCKVKFTNDKLHQRIKQLCHQNFLSKLDSKLADKWEKESPLFVVTTAAPIAAQDGLYEFATVEADLPVSCSERKTFVYKHPSNNRIFFRVHEPASPADVDGIPGDDSTHPFSMAPVENGRSEQENQQRMLATKDKLSCQHDAVIIAPAEAGQSEQKSQQRTLTTKDKLICQQEAVITSFRQNHDVRGKPQHAMTAVISTAMNPDGNISTSIIVVRGIIRAKNRMENINESGKIPFILSFAWIYDEGLKGRVEEIWSTYVKDAEMKCWPPYAMAIDYKNWEELKGPKAPTKSQQPQRQPQQQGRIGFKSSSIIFQSDGKYSFRIGIPKESQKLYNLMDTVEAHQKSLLPDGDLQKMWNENLKRITDTAESMLNGPGRMTSDHCNLTVTAVESRYTLFPTLRPQRSNSRPDSLSIEKFIVFVVAIGSSPNDIGTPSEFTYHDVLNLLKCRTWHFNNQPVMANLIETYWKGKTTVDAKGNPCRLDVIRSTDQLCKKAKHIILPLPTNTASFDASFDQKNNVRLKAKSFEMRSHEANLDSLKWHITDLQDYNDVREALERASDKSRPVTSEMLPERLKPISFEYPVMKISALELSGLPNCVGTPVFGPQQKVQCYYQQNQNETHMKYARPGTAPNSPTIKTVLEHLPPDPTGSDTSVNLKANGVRKS